jgi:hypothetical protein
MISTLFVAALSLVSEPPSIFSTVDVDRDGRPDICELQPDGRLLLIGTEVGGRLVDRTAELGLDRVSLATKAKWRDIDGDGWEDLVVQTQEGSLLLYRNVHGDVFEEQRLYQGTPGRLTVGWQWIRIDSDDSVDLVVRTQSTVHLMVAGRDGSFRESGSLTIGVDGPDVVPTARAVATEGYEPVGLVPRPLGSLDLERVSPHPPLGGGDEPGRERVGSSGRMAVASPSISGQTVEFVAGAATPVVDGCAMSVRDAATTGCVSASSIPLLGALYPLGTEFFIDPDGRVSLGTTTPNPARLTVLADPAPGSAGDGVYIDTAVGGGTALRAISSSNSDGVGLRAEANSEFGRAVRGVNNSMAGKSIALEGISRSPDAEAIFGYATSTAGSAVAIRGLSDAEDGTAVYGEAAGTGACMGIIGETQSSDAGAAGVFGFVDAKDGEASGVLGLVDSDVGYGVRARNEADPGINGVPTALFADTASKHGIGVFARTEADGVDDSGIAIHGAASHTGIGVFGSTGNFIHFGAETLPYGLLLAPGTTAGSGGINWHQSGRAYGVFGTTSSADITAAGVLGSGAHIGVEGIAHDGLSGSAGVLGQYSLSSGEPVGLAAGVRGEVGTTGIHGAGVLGKHAGQGFGLFGDCNDGYGIYATSGNGTAVFSEGDMFVNGALAVAGNKNFVHPHPTDPSKEIRFSCLEGNESGTYFRGRAELVRGRATIVVPESFRLVTDEENLSVHLTSIGGPALLWVESQDLQRIVVRGEPDAHFHYLVNGVRAGFADQETIGENRHFVPAFEDRSYGQSLPAAVRETLIRTGILRPDGLPDRKLAESLGWTLRQSGEGKATTRVDGSLQSAADPVEVQPTLRVIRGQRPSMGDTD